MFYEEEQMSLFGQDGWSGKMSVEPPHPTAEKTLQPSSKKSSKSASQMPMCKCVRRISDGLNPAATILLMEDGPLLGEYTMRSFGEYPKEENESRLSWILEDSPHPRYSLSAKACLGILNRAESRGKELPAALLKALTEQAKSPQPLMPTTDGELESGGGQERTYLMQSVSKNERGNQGGGKGILIQPERTGALSTLNNQSVFRSTNSVGYNIGSYYSSGMMSENPHVGIYQTEVTRSLDAQTCGNPSCNQGGTAVVAVDCRNGTEGEVNGTLQAHPSGGGSVNLNNVIRVAGVPDSCTSKERKEKESDGKKNRLPPCAAGDRTP